MQPGLLLIHDLTTMITCLPYSLYAWDISGGCPQAGQELEKHKLAIYQEAGQMSLPFHELVGFPHSMVATG